MACNALKQMILQVRWGELDFLLIDMPPGTGDIHISLVHDIPMEGAVIVSTPQDVALADVEKGVNMFRNESVNKPILGRLNILMKSITFSERKEECAWQRNTRFHSLARFLSYKAYEKEEMTANQLHFRQGRMDLHLWHSPKNLPE